MPVSFWGLPGRIRRHPTVGRPGVSQGGIWTLIHLLRPYRWQAVCLVVLGIAASLFETISVSLLIPILQVLSATPGEATSSPTGHAIMDIVRQPFAGMPLERQLQWILVVLLGLVLIKNAVNYTLEVATFRLRIRLESDLSLQVFEQLMRIGYRFITDHSSGELHVYLRSEPKRAGVALQNAIQFLQHLCLIVAYTVLMVWISWPLTLLTLTFLALLSWCLHRLTRVANIVGERFGEALSQLAQVGMEMFAGMRVIRAFGREPFEYQRYRDRVDHLQQLHVQAVQLSSLSMPLAEMLSVAFLGIFLLYSAPWILGRQTIVPILLTFLFVLYRLLPRVASLNAARVSVALYLPGADAVARLLDPHDKPRLISGRRPFEAIRQGIRCERLTFAYHATGQPVLKGIDLDIPAGRTTAIVGLSGVGKSTLADLLLRFYDPDDGRILVDTIDLRELDVAQWRAAIGVVSHEPFLFHASVRDNIAYGALTATDADIVEAAQVAYAHEFILALPHGYDTVIGDRGMRLSAGQRQRLAIARAILRNPQLLILDEATSELDSESEWRVQQALDTVSAHRTVLIIAHRLSSIVHADRILVLENGRVVEQGTHDELLARGGCYQTFWRLQVGEREALGSQISS